MDYLVKRCHRLRWQTVELLESWTQTQDSNADEQRVLFIVNSETTTMYIPRHCGPRGDSSPHGAECPKWDKSNSKLLFHTVTPLPAQVALSK